MKRTLTALLAFAVLSGSALAAESPAEKQNIQNVVNFYNKGLNEKNFDAARPYLGNDYKQHNPGAQDGIEGFRHFVAFLQQKYPHSHSEIVRTFADGDYVILHVKTTGREAGETKAIVDIFRLDPQHKIVEHWDVTQVVPDKTVSGNSMF
ncbi:MULTISPECIES: nuclear transport factor 2 family protein [Pantoea]|uniref:Polyketide cyclase n=1 Tax=Candidatus Pantoea multigeneris TaxID=2608357 RepID=A0ABX0RGL8_9GAMM|nr:MULTISPECIES: nuclear transport factor 2 family protein [Pantoea]NIF24451.1 polyketide cyclase [Pantoea multigeneris]